MPLNIAREIDFTPSGFTINMGLPVHVWCMLCGGVIDPGGNRLVERSQPFNDALEYRLVDAAALEDNYLMNDEHQWRGFHRMSEYQYCTIRSP